MNPVLSLSSGQQQQQQLMEQQQQQSRLSADNAAFATTTAKEEGVMGVVVPPVDVDTVDQQLTKAIHTLSVKDRLAVQEEIHGVRTGFDELKETSEFLQSKLNELQHEIDQLPVTSKVAYNVSQQLHVPPHPNNNNNNNNNPSSSSCGNSFVNGSDFRLRFLRADMFDVKLAAIRLVKFLDFTRELFGDFVLSRPIRITDLTKDEMDLVRCGYQQLLPFPDRTGRRVVAYIGDFGITDYSLRLRARVCVYFLWVASESLEAQQKGCVVVVWPTLSILQRIPPMDEHIVGGKIVDTAPIRMASIHFCMSFPEYFALFKLMRAIVISAFSTYKVRISFHTGSATVCKYELMTFGVPVEVFPMTETVNIKTKNQHQWIKARRAIENFEQEFGPPMVDSTNHNVIRSISPDSSGSTVPNAASAVSQRTNDDGKASDRPIEYPNLRDVCFRYGMAYQWHKGNARFRELLELHMDEHDDAMSNDEKVAVTHKILEKLDEWDCRFLSWDRQGWWNEITERNTKRIKIAVAMKEHKKRLQARHNYQTNNSSTNKFALSMDGKKRKRTMNEDGSSQLSSCFL